MPKIDPAEKERRRQEREVKRASKEAERVRIQTLRAGVAARKAREAAERAKRKADKERKRAERDAKAAAVARERAQGQKKRKAEQSATLAECNRKLVAAEKRLAKLQQSKPKPTKKTYMTPTKSKRKNPVTPKNTCVPEGGVDTDPCFGDVVRETVERYCSGKLQECGAYEMDGAELEYKLPYNDKFVRKLRSEIEKCRGNGCTVSDNAEDDVVEFLVENYEQMYNELNEKMQMERNAKLDKRAAKRREKLFAYFDDKKLPHPVAVERKFGQLVAAEYISALEGLQTHPDTAQDIDIQYRNANGRGSGFFSRTHVDAYIRAANELAEQ